MKQTERNSNADKRIPPSAYPVLPVFFSSFFSLLLSIILFFPLNSFARHNADNFSSTTISPEEYTLIGKGDNYEVVVVYPGTGNSIVDMELALWAKSRANTFIRSVHGITASLEIPHTLDIYYESIKASDTTISIIFTSTITMSAGSPEDGITTLTFDLRDGRLLSYPDLFQNTDSLLESFSLISQNALIDLFDDLTDLQMLEFGTSPEPANFDLFSISPIGLTLYFPPGQAAPPQKGSLRVNIAIEELSSFKPRQSLWERKKTQ